LEEKQAYQNKVKLNCTIAVFNYYWKKNRG
jgi:hypothetical protein